MRSSMVYSAAGRLVLNISASGRKIALREQKSPHHFCSVFMQTLLIKLRAESSLMSAFNE